MSYIIKKDKAKEIKSKYLNSYIARETGKHYSTISLVLNGKLKPSKTLALAITTVVDKNLKIEDLFDEV